MIRNRHLLVASLALMATVAKAQVVLNPNDKNPPTRQGTRGAALSRPAPTWSARELRDEALAVLDRNNERGDLGLRPGRSGRGYAGPRMRTRTGQLLPFTLLLPSMAFVAVLIVIPMAQARITSFGRAMACWPKHTSCSLVSSRAAAMPITPPRWRR